MDVLDNAFPQLHIGRFTRWGLGKLLFSLVLALSAVALAVFFYTFLPLHIDDPFSGPWGWAHAIFGTWLWINTVVHYAFAATIDPGIIPPAAEQDCAHVGNSAESKKAFCSLCSAPRLPLAHHCQTCRACIETMDHHCPFTMNCVGKHNFFHFYLFLFYACSGLLYATCLSFPVFFECWILDGPCRLPGTLSLMFIPAGVLWTSVLGLLGFHTLLLLANMSTVDCLVTLRRSSFRTLVQSMLDPARRDSKLRQLVLVGRPAWHFVVPARVAARPKTN